MSTIHDVELNDAQMDAMCQDTHIITSDATATEVMVRSAWVLFKARHYVATVYSQAIALDMLSTGRADLAGSTRAYRHPMTDEQKAREQA